MYTLKENPFSGSRKSLKGFDTNNFSSRRIISSFTHHSIHLGTPSLPSAALGKGHSRKNYRQRPIYQEPFVGHLAKKSRTSRWGNGDGGFAECHSHGTRQSRLLCRVPSAAGTRQRCLVCRVPGPWHSANPPGLPSDLVMALGKPGPQVPDSGHFAECHDHSTR
jgi:hypothetical protein